MVVIVHPIAILMVVLVLCMVNLPMGIHHYPLVIPALHMMHLAL